NFGAPPFGDVTIDEPARGVKGIRQREHALILSRVVDLDRDPGSGIRKSGAEVGARGARSAIGARGAGSASGAIGATSAMGATSATTHLLHPIAPLAPLPTQCMR